MLTKRVVFIALMAISAGIVFGAGPAMAENASATFYVT